jgi:Putative MetA-pathway of phenol degradation
MFRQGSAIVVRAAMRRRALVFSAAFLFFAVPSRAQTDSSTSSFDVTISTDRNAVAESSVVVPQGGFQMENGFLLTNAQGQTIVDFPESDFRYGLLQKTELRFSAPDYFDTVSSGAAPVSGFGDVALGVKQQLGPIAGFDISAIVFLSFPTGSRTVSSHGYDPGLQLAWSRSVSKNWTVGGQAAFYWPTVGGAHDFTGETTFFADRQLTKPWDAYLEWAGDFPERGGNRQQVHVGTTYKLTRRQQLDFHFAFGLTSAAPKAYVGFGYSFLILPRR